MSENKEVLVALSSLPVGQKALIVAFTFDTKEGERIQEMGLYPGEQVEVMRLPTGNDLLEIKIRQYFVSLQQQQADHIKVKILP